MTLSHGAIYYCVIEENGIPLIETWRYVGYVKRNFNTPRCDIPYYFYEFELVSWGIEQSNRKLVPSIEMIGSMFMLDFSALMEVLSQFE